MLAFTLTELTLRVDSLARFELTLGRPTFLRIQSKLSEKELGQRVLHELERATRNFTLAERLRFRLNVGSRKWQVNPSACFYCRGTARCNQHGKCGYTVIPAYAVFYGNVKEAIKYGQIHWNVKPLTKVKGKPNHGAIYVGISPYWSKGLKQWDNAWATPSTYAPYPIPSFLYYSLASYTITVTIGKPQNVFTQILFSPPLGRMLSHEETVRTLMLVRRIISIVDLEADAIIRTGFPTLTLPLTLLGHLDLSAIHELLRVIPSIILTDYDLGRGCPKNPRGYEEFSTAEVLEFYKRLGPFFWNFRAMLIDLIRVARREEFRTRIFDILMDLSMAIKNGDIHRFNDALLKVQSLSKERGVHHVHYPNRKEVFTIQKAIRAF